MVNYVVIEQCETAINGEVVVALLENGTATLKPSLKATRIRLEPANSAMSPYLLPMSDPRPRRRRHPKYAP